MRRSTKAALISGLVFPGLGHVFLRKYVVGVVLLCLAGWSIYSVATTAIETALDVATEIESRGVAVDSVSIGQLVAQRLEKTEQSTNASMWVLLVTWLIGIADSYRVGRGQEQLEESRAAKRT